MVPIRKDGLFSPFPVISQSRLGYFLSFITCACTENRERRVPIRSSLFIQKEAEALYKFKMQAGREIINKYENQRFVGLVNCSNEGFLQNKTE